MTVSNSITAQPAAESSAAEGKSAPASSPEPSPLANKETFLKLLVAQIKNQNPLNPADGVQFLSQLAQFSELEQLIEIRQGVDKLTGGSPAETAPAGGTAGESVPAPANGN